MAIAVMRGYGIEGPEAVHATRFLLDPKRVAVEITLFASSFI